MSQRNIGDVIDRVIAELPTDEVELIAELRRVKDSAGFTPPEGMILRWRRAADALVHAAAGKPWAKKVEAIWIGEA